MKDNIKTEIKEINKYFLFNFVKLLFTSKVFVNNLTENALNVNMY